MPDASPSSATKCLSCHDGYGRARSVCTIPGDEFHVQVTYQCSRCRHQWCVRLVSATLSRDTEQLIAVMHQMLRKPPTP